MTKQNFQSDFLNVSAVLYLISVYFIGATACLPCPSGYSSGRGTSVHSRYHPLIHNSIRIVCQGYQSFRLQNLALALVALLLYLSYFFIAGLQRNSILTSCSPSETVYVLVIPTLSKADFLLVKDNYIACIATTAGVDRGNVNILSIDDTGTSRMIATRLLLASSVRVQTSVVISRGQQSFI